MWRDGRSLGTSGSHVHTLWLRNNLKYQCTWSNQRTVGQRVLHRNLLTQCMFIPVEEVSGVTAGKEESHFTLSETSTEEDLQQVSDLEGTEETGVAMQLGESSQETQAETEMDEPAVRRAGGNAPASLDGAGSPQEDELPRRNPPRNRHPPKRLSFESQVTKTEEECQKHTSPTSKTQRRVHRVSSTSHRRTEG
ncbi:hypothetical protein ATANTOWER_032647 [Ataeniobius toweri]|uniref:Uncharacterized protein n=1 Tax=Ataeniobius toweri TaxID=208326 RepID=A0ABU7BSL0_9TELE|nr:hypothetical protein [Ataeniobius toweri]